MFEVPIDKIMPVTVARAKISSLVHDVHKTKSLYVLTRGGKPAAILASIDYIKKIKQPSVSLSEKEEKNTFKKSEEKPLTNQKKVEDSIQIDKNKIENSYSTDEDTVNNEQPVRISIK